jgi:regulator of protease activity HflC (stomatin/prohibitin superfamily)
MTIRMREETNDAKYMVWAGIIVLALIFSSVGGCMWGWPQYKVWQQGQEGMAELRRAEQNRQIKIQEAHATQESSELLAQAEITRAKGVAEANRIIGNSLKDNEAYLRYLWIHNLETGNNNVIYIPTEAGLPILEAGKRPVEKK